ncbi:MAG: hypothetical protein GY811_19860 [Myxococcales bacterium]|nr:hypothetical protein [Myxococcales bacterium]
MTRFERNYQDPRTQRVLGFLMAKGLLIGDGIPLRGDVKLSIKDVLWVGAKVEPRVLEVLPAALIHFPRTFMGAAQIPEDLAEVIGAIRAREDQGPDFRGMRFRAMSKWANRATSDKRTKPLNKIKVNKTFRMAPDAIAALIGGAEKAGVSQTQFLEQLLLA